jgi:hypothetical protein
LFLSVLTCGSVTACAADCFCDLSLAAIRVLITDEDGTPVEGLEFSVNVERTGEQVVFPAEVPHEGWYPVITDVEQKYIDPSGEQLRFAATDGQRTVTAQYVVDMPGRCNCHVNKVSGPDTLVIH